MAAAAQYSRLGVRRLVALESVTKVVLVVHVTLRAQVIVKAHLALPSHSHDAVLLAAVTDYVGVTHACKGREGRWKTGECSYSFDAFLHMQITQAHAVSFLPRVTYHSGSERVMWKN